MSPGLSATCSITQANGCLSRYIANGTLEFLPCFLLQVGLVFYSVTQQTKQELDTLSDFSFSSKGMKDTIYKEEASQQ